jgi:uncharacterized damage-inducible protein DinB
MMNWLDRRFAYEPPVGEFPAIVERLRGTPARVEEKAARIRESVRLFKPGEEWSIQEHLGHLVDLEGLWARRTEELLRVARGRWVDRLDACSDADVARSSLHPRLKRPMRLVDLCFFVAEHDDHHLAVVTRLARTHER